jgi:hypothetical protein
VAVVVVGARPYPGDEIAAALDAPLAGVVAWDPRGVTAMWARGERGRGRRSWLARSASAVLVGLEALVPPARMQERPESDTKTMGGVR